MRLTPFEQRAIYDAAEKENRAFFVYWNYSAEDIIFNIKRVYPELKASPKGMTRVLGDLKETIIVGGVEYLFNTESESHVYEIIKVINHHLSKSNLTLVTFDSGGEDITFILINLKELPSYLEKGFLEV